MSPCYSKWQNFHWGISLMLATPTLVGDTEWTCRTQVQKDSSSWFCLDPAGPGVKPQKKNPSESKVKIAKKERGLPSLYSFLESWWWHLQSNKIWVSWQDTLSYSPRKLCVFLLISTTWLFLPSQVYYRWQFSFHQESNLHCVNVPQSPLESLPIKQFWIQKHFHLHEVQAN